MSEAAAGFLAVQERQGILPRNPFISIDVDGVGELMRKISVGSRISR